MNNTEVLYNKLLSEKANGKTFNIKEVDYNTMYQLWYKEMISDKELAALFDTTKYQVQSRRQQLDINVRSMAIQEVMEKYGHMPEFTSIEIE